MRIANNLLAANASRQFGISADKDKKNTEKLSSGYRINRAGDDAAGLLISEKMRRQIRGLNKGVENSKEGVALCQVEDGALAQVQDMLHRITELSVKAANGTNSPSDREAIQKEINKLIQEIDRIGETTKHNETYVFKGDNVTVVHSAPTPGGAGGSVDALDYFYSDITLIGGVFEGSNSGDTFNLRAQINNPDSVDDGKVFDVIKRSNSSVRFTYKDGTEEIVPFSSMTPYFNGPPRSDYPTITLERRGVKYRDTKGTHISIMLSTQVNNNTHPDPNYFGISFEVNSLGPEDKLAKTELLFHFDTTYNGDDNGEEYYKGGNKVENAIVLTGSDIWDSISSINPVSQLPYSQIFSFAGLDEPEKVAIGKASEIADWSCIDNGGDGTSLNNVDKGLAAVWDITNKTSVGFGFSLIAKENDNNIPEAVINPAGEDSTATASVTYSIHQRLRIQSGADAKDGLYLTLTEMNSKSLGINTANVTTQEKARETIDLVSKALEKISAHRSRVGAEQNRLEHTIANEENVLENTTAAESRIRDTDMAKTMVEYSQAKIILQSSQSMLAQASQLPKTVVSLLQQ